MSFPVDATEPAHNRASRERRLLDERYGWARVQTKTNENLAIMKLMAYVATPLAAAFTITFGVLTYLSIQAELTDHYSAGSWWGDHYFSVFTGIVCMLGFGGLVWLVRNSWMEFGSVVAGLERAAAEIEQIDKKLDML